MHSADKCRNQMRVGRMIVITGAVKVSQHRHQKTRLVLAVISPTHFYARNLRYCIGPIRELQGTRK